jgi:TPR repeat protein
MDREVITAAMVVVGIAAAIAAAAIIFLVIDRPLRDSSGPEAARAQAAREVIDDLGEADSADFQQAYERAQEFRREDRLADAQVLYFFAARGGHAQSQYELATMNDPLYHSDQTSLLGDPDPFQAYKWYSAALQRGIAAAECASTPFTTGRAQLLRTAISKPSGCFCNGNDQPKFGTRVPRIWMLPQARPAASARRQSGERVSCNA